MILDEIHLLGADRGPILEVLNYTHCYGCTEICCFTNGFKNIPFLHPLL